MAKKRSASEGSDEVIPLGPSSSSDGGGDSGAEAPAARNEEDAARILDELPEDALIVLAARNMLLFPRVVLPIVVGRARSVRAVRAAVQAERPIGVLLQKDPQNEEPGPDDLHRVGTVAGIVRYITTPDGNHHVIVQGEQRFRVREYVQKEPFLVARVERIEEPDAPPQDKEIEARFLNLKSQAHQALALLPQKPEDLDQAIDNSTSPSAMADLVATFMDIPVEEKQEILETFDLSERMDKVSDKLAHLTEVLRLSMEIREKTQGRMAKAQREYYLREQLSQIQKELGEGQSVELQDLAAQIEKTKMPTDVKEEARRELGRLQRMPEAAAEYGMVRTYLEWLVELPWAKSTKDKLDVEQARAILDEDHYGLPRIKKRILEFLAVRKLKPDGKGPILCFVGPPGVGKTSLGRSIARAMNRKFVRLSLGGVHDEAEIRGHRRTYVGALPGSVIQQIRKAGANNPVFMLDEMDKLGVSLHGDPSSALLEVLDPEQNRTFTDHYLNVPFDLSKVMVIGTANVLDAIPGPLRDRCEVIELSGYTEEEKFQIARRYLVARRVEANGLTAQQFELTDDALHAIIRSYTREAGVRNLEREIGAVARHAATRVAAGQAERVRVGPEDLRAILGPVRFESELALRTSKPGVATGLAWTPVGGEILFIEASIMPGSGSLILTGQLGDVMKESARAAISLVKANLTELGIDATAFEKSDIHIHVPAGAIPKDGPSAGVAMYTALVSLLTGRTVKSDLAMTGEISLRGLVLPVGGIKEKVLAGHAAGIQKVLLPARNEKDFEEIPESVRKELAFVWVEDVRQLLAEALGEKDEEFGSFGDGTAYSERISATAGGTSQART
jgi:ATP-dependent Lon protease